MTKSGKEHSDWYLMVSDYLLLSSCFFWSLLGYIHYWFWVGRPYENEAIKLSSAPLEQRELLATDPQGMDSHTTQQRSRNNDVDGGDETLSTSPNHQPDVMISMEGGNNFDSDSESDEIENEDVCPLTPWNMLSVPLGGLAVHLFLRQGFISFKEAFLLVARTTSGTNLDEPNCGDYKLACYEFFLFLLLFSCFFPAVQHFLYILSDGRKSFGQLLPVLFPFFEFTQQSVIKKPDKQRIMEIKTYWKVGDFYFIEPLKGHWLIIWHVCLTILTFSLISALWPLFIDQGIIGIRFQSGACPADYQCFRSNSSKFSHTAPCDGAIRVNCSSNLTENTDEMYCVRVHNTSRWDFVLVLASCYTVYAVLMKVIKAVFSIVSSQCSARLDQYPRRRPTAFYAVVLFVAMVVLYSVVGISIVRGHLRKVVYSYSIEILFSFLYCFLLSLALPLIVYMLDFRINVGDIIPRTVYLPSWRGSNSEKRPLMS